MGEGKIMRPKWSLGVKELSSGLFYRDVFSEGLGTFLLLCVVSLLSANTGENPVPVHVALGAGLAVGTIIWCTACASGGLVNPAMSVSLTLVGHMSLIRGICYTASQCAGAYLAVSYISVLLPDGAIPDAYACTGLNNISPIQGVGIEIILTTFVSYTIHSVVDTNRPELGGSAPLSIGLSVVLAHLIGMRFTGASMNPARSFGPAMKSGHWENHWVYWVGPCAGATISGYVYEYIMKADSSRQKVREVLCCNSSATTIETVEMKQSA